MHHLRESSIFTFVLSDGILYKGITYYIIKSDGGTGPMKSGNHSMVLNPAV